MAFTVPAPIRTARLLLVPATADLVAADMDDPPELGRLLGARVPAGWPPELVRDALPVFRDLLFRRPELTGWLLWYWVLQEGPGGVIVGDGGFGGWPESGTVVTGYSLMPEFFGRGYATEAVGGLVGWAFGHSNVRRVAADVFPENGASARVLEKLGFSRTGDGAEPGSVRYMRFRHESDDQGERGGGKTIRNP